MPARRLRPARRARLRSREGYGGGGSLGVLVSMTSVGVAAGIGGVSRVSDMVDGTRGWWSRVERGRTSAPSASRTILSQKSAAGRARTSADARGKCELATRLNRALSHACWRSIRDSSNFIEFRKLLLMVGNGMAGVYARRNLASIVSMLRWRHGDSVKHRMEADPTSQVRTPPATPTPRPAARGWKPPRSLHHSTPPSWGLEPKQLKYTSHCQKIAL